YVLFLMLLPGSMSRALPAALPTSGNIEPLLDHATVTAGAHPAMTTNCFSFLFCNCTALSSAPALPATTLAKSCYYRMFAGCTGLDRKSTRLNSSHVKISYAVFCLK